MPSAPPPARRFHDLVDALDQPAARDTQAVDGGRVRLDGDLPAICGGVETELLGDFVELALERVAWLRRAMTALGPTGGLVGVEAHAVELIAGNLVGDRE